MKKLSALLAVLILSASSTAAMARDHHNWNGNWGHNFGHGWNGHDNGLHRGWFKHRSAWNNNNWNWRNRNNNWNWRNSWQQQHRWSAHRSYQRWW